MKGYTKYKPYTHALTTPPTKAEMSHLTRGEVRKWRKDRKQGLEVVRVSCKYFPASTS